MKTIKLSVIGMSLLADGGAAILTKPSSTNPSANGVHVVNAGQLARLSTRALGFNSPMALKHAIGVANGAGILSIEATDVKAGDVWENKTTGETGVHTKDYTKYSNHELDLGFAVSMKMLEIAAMAGINNAAPFVSTPKKAPVVLGVSADTTGTVDTTTSTEEPNV
jgi:hypothetical protein